MKTTEKLSLYWHNVLYPKLVKTAVVSGVVFAVSLPFAVEYGARVKEFMNQKYDDIFYSDCPKISIKRDICQCRLGTDGFGPIYDTREHASVDFESRTPGVNLVKFILYSGEGDTVRLERNLHSENASLSISTEDPVYNSGSISDIFKRRPKNDYYAEVIDENGKKNKRFICSGFWRYACNFSLVEKKEAKANAKH